ncbi:MAG: MBL fold metallo-hydrolase [Bacteroidota bacterium]
MLWILGIIGLIGGGGWAFLTFNPQFGGKITAALKERYARSSQWDGKQFNNATETVMDINLSNMPGLLREQLTNTKVRSPEQPIPILPFDSAWEELSPELPAFVWYGHSVCLLRLEGKWFLIDPMLGPDAAPIAPFASKRFSEQSLAVIEHLPSLEAVLMTHDHYDHLDYASMKKLIPKVNRFVVSLGVGRHLEAWGVPADQITELAWWEDTEVSGIQITSTPSRHFSGRGPFDRGHGFWGGFAFRTLSHNIYWSGDGGYESHFKEVGERLGPFDWGFMECGQYNERWHAIHLYPEESVQAAKDAGVRMAIPVHWGGFALALHTWQDPIERFTKAAKQEDLPMLSPPLGQTVILGSESSVSSDWWQSLS